MTAQPRGTTAARASQLQVDLGPQDEHTMLIKATGELDLCSAPRFAEALDQALSTGCRDVALDLDGLRFCDAAGVDLIVDARQRLSRQNRCLSVTRSSPAVRRVLELTGTAHVLTEGTVPVDGSR